MTRLVFAIGLCVLIGGCAFRSETVVERPTPAPVVVANPPPPATVYVPVRN